MKSNELQVLNEVLINMLTQSITKMRIYEQQYEEYQSNDTNENDKESEYNQLKELLQINEEIIEYENQLNDAIAVLLPKYMEYFWFMKQQQNEIKNKINLSIDELMKSTKKDLKETKHKTMYQRRKEELEKKYIETEEIKQRQEQKKEKQRRKMLNEQFELKWNEIIEKSITIEKDMKSMKEIKENEKKDKEESKYYGTINILLLGETYCGSKSSFIEKYVNNSFKESGLPSTVSVGCVPKVVDYNNHIVKLMLWDTPGQQKYRQLLRYSINRNEGFIIGYDITDRNSFEILDEWFNLVEQNKENKSLIILVGAKCDKEDERKVSREEGELYAKTKGVDFFEVSSKSGMNVENTIQRMIELVVCERMGKQPKPMRKINENETINELQENYWIYSPSEIRKIVEEWTKKQFGEILFDTKDNQWKQNDCLLFDKLQKKSQLLILIDDGIHHFGCYIDSVVNTESGKYIDDKNCFLFSIERKEIYSIKQSKYSLCIHQSNEEKLITIGKEDVVLFKEEKKDQCYCKQSSFDYGRQMGRLIGKEGYTLW